MHNNVSALSNKERETLRLVTSGLKASSIALELGISVHTVNERLSNARKKLGTTSSLEAARMLAYAEKTNLT